MKYAILSMDIEDWYHLDYFNGKIINNKISTLDGIQEYANILNEYNIKTTFFVLGELVNKNLRKPLSELISGGHEIASHGWDHKRPLNMNLKEFEQDLLRSKCILEDQLQVKIEGYRAPCFSLNRERLDLVKSVGYSYDSSKIKCNSHPLYGDLDIDNFTLVNKNIHKNEDFYEFELSTLNIFGRNMPISGGGYLRIFPWYITKSLIKKYLKDNNIYTFYIHPFETSKVHVALPNNLNIINKKRFTTGLGKVGIKISKLINLLKNNGFEFITFRDLKDNKFNSFKN